MTLDSLLRLFFENSPLVGIFFVVGGLIKIFSYYKLFGIYIYEFIDLREVVTLFVNNLLAYFIVLILVSVTLLNIPSIEHLKLLIPVIFTILTIFYFFTRKHVFIYEIIILNVLFWVFYFSIKSLTPILNSNKYDSQTVKNYTLFTLLITLIIYSIANAFTEYLKVKYKRYYSKTLIYLEGNELAANSSKHYIGKTEKFIFLYDNQSNSAEAIPANRIIKIVFSKQ